MLGRQELRRRKNLIANAKRKLGLVFCVGEGPEGGNSIFNNAKRNVEFGGFFFFFFKFGNWANSKKIGPAQLEVDGPDEPIWTGFFGPIKLEPRPTLISGWLGSNCML